MSKPRIILASLTKIIKNWWKFDEVLTKNHFAQFFETWCTKICVFIV